MPHVEGYGEQRVAGVGGARSAPVKADGWPAIAGKARGRAGHAVNPGHEVTVNAGCSRPVAKGKVESMYSKEMRLATMMIAMCLLISACDAFHEGPGSTAIDDAVRRALDAANRGGINALVSSPMPMSADVASVKPDGDCAKTFADTFACDVSIVRRASPPDGSGTTLHASLVFTKDANGDWQTSNVDRALAVGAAKSVVDQVSHALPGQTGVEPGVT